MSTDWNIRCVDCNDTHIFNDANRMCDLMVLLIEHAPAIAALAPLLKASPDVQFAAGYGGTYGSIDPSWFATHLGHRLRPIDEYGGLLGQCWKYLGCSECGATRHCALDDSHDGPCDPKATPG